MADEYTLETLLEPFKAEEEQHVYTASILVDDSAAHKIVAAWTMIPLTWTDPKGDYPDDPRLQWDWVWEGVTIPWQELAKRSGIDLPRVQKLFEPLRANRLIYPDGTATEHALGVLKAAVVQGLQKTKKR